MSPPLYLIRVVTFLFQVWVPIYLLTKIYSKKFMGPQLVFKEIQLGKLHLTDEELNAAGLKSAGLKSAN